MKRRIEAKGRGKEDQKYQEARRDSARRNCKDISKTMFDPSFVDTRAQTPDSPDQLVSQARHNQPDGSDLER